MSAAGLCVECLVSLVVVIFLEGGSNLGRWGFQRKALDRRCTFYFDCLCGHHYCSACVEVLSGHHVALGVVRPMCWSFCLLSHFFPLWECLWSHSLVLFPSLLLSIHHEANALLLPLSGCFLQAHGASHDRMSSSKRWAKRDSFSRKFFSWVF